MKFVILLAIIGFVAAAPVSKEELLKRATDLEAKLAAAEEKIKTTKPVDAKILETEIQTLKVLSKDLEGASNAAVIAGIEERLTLAERAAEATLKRIESAVFSVAAPTKEELIKKATDLETRLAAAADKLRATKPEEAKTLESESKNLKTIVSELEAAKETAVVARLETLLAGVEKTVEARLKIDETPVFSVAAPTKEELLKAATDLETRLTAAEAKVKTSHPAEARILEAEIRNLKTISAELEKATEAAVVARLEARLASVEKTAEATLKRIEGQSGTSTTAASFVAAPTKEELLKAATDLETRLADAETKVKTSHPQEARMLENEIRALKTISAELEKATEAAVVARLEARLASTERIAEIILKRIEGQPGTTTAASFVGAPTKEELISKATELETALQADVDKVRSTHPIEVRILESEIRELKTLAGELTTATNEQIIRHLEQRLAAVERRAEETLKRIDGRAGTTAASFEVAAPTKEELEKRATDLETKLQAEVDKVRTGHPVEARILESEIRELKLLAGELATAKNAQVVAHLETRLAGVERRADETIRRLEGRTGAPTTEAPVTTAASF